MACLRILSCISIISTSTDSRRISLSRKSSVASSYCIRMSSDPDRSLAPSVQRGMLVVGAWFDSGGEEAGMLVSSGLSLYGGPDVFGLCGGVSMARRLYLPDGCFVPWYNPVQLDPNGMGLSCISIGQGGWYELQVDERGELVGMDE